VDVNEYVKNFVNKAEELGYEIETVQRGKYKGEPQIVFPNKKLHAGHLRNLYPLAMKQTDADFEDIVPGRPCAVAPFNQINHFILSR